jgi:hypothetical protein
LDTERGIRGGKSRVEDQEGLVGTAKVSG